MQDLILDIVAQLNRISKVGAYIEEDDVLCPIIRFEGKYPGFVLTAKFDDFHTKENRQAVQRELEILANELCESEEWDVFVTVNNSIRYSIRLCPTIFGEDMMAERMECDDE